ncbi:MAG TPA: ribosomal-protein-alanine N-acetyltransferase [Thioalkalivibrio sp.]|nr:ribosomal-protein-alanine N-acetyltransferase [Thioalkalivibrio sp.]
MRTDDLDAVMEIEVRAYPYPWTRGIFHDCLRVGYSCWVYEDREAHALIAYGVMTFAVDECHLMNLTVRPELQGQGLGRRLLRDLVEMSRLAGAARVLLEVRPSNEPALALYRAEGFAQIGRRKNYYPAPAGREDALVLVRELFVPGENA